MINIKTLQPGKLLIVQEEHTFHNEGYPTEQEKSFVPWNGLNKKYKSLNLHKKGKPYILKKGEPILFLDFLYRVIGKTSMDYYQRQEVKYIQTGILALHGLNNIFISINTMRYDVFEELPTDIQETFYKTYLFKVLQ